MRSNLRPNLRPNFRANLRSNLRAAMRPNLRVSTADADPVRRTGVRRLRARALRLPRPSRSSVLVRGLPS